MIDSMEISQEIQAPSTEMSNKLPPIPPIPNSPSPTAPPPPSQLHLPNNTTASRKILKPAVPSKRPIHERPLINNKNSSDVANAFLPRELAEIVATRQHRERAWHARIMICTTAYSNIESTLANFSDETEKEEVTAFKEYIRRAIANFAAVDSSPSPPRVPVHTRPKKGDGSKNGKGNDEEKKKEKVWKKIVIATPQISPSQVASRGSINEVELQNNYQTSNNTWATVARKGQKKARVDLGVKTQAVTGSKITQKSPKNFNSVRQDSDNRLFVRLPQDHDWRKLSPAGIREVVVKKLSISPALIGKIKPVHSGFALSPCSTEAREKLLNAGNGFFLSGAKLEPATNWVPILIPTVPSSIYLEQGKTEVSNSMLIDEIERVCAVRPAHLKLYGQNNVQAPHRTWMAYFSKAPRYGFRVFDESGVARPFKKQQTHMFCKRCNGHHPTKNCSRCDKAR